MNPAELPCPGPPRAAGTQVQELDRAWYLHPKLQGKGVVACPPRTP